MSVIWDGSAWQPLPGTVVQGEKGDPGQDATIADMSYTYQQNTPESVWTIQHDLGFNPSVVVIDSAGSNIIGHVEYLSVNQLRLTFSAAFSGVAHLS